MARIVYHKLTVLVADDFSSFRNTVTRMLQNLGVQYVEMASNGDEAIEKCEQNNFDLILCDYNLGESRNGQHVLEEAKHRKLIDHETIFIIISAEASRNIVMSAFDCEPDDYLMKPITARMLQQRMDKLLKQRDVMRPVHCALDAEDWIGATDLLIDLSLAEDRYSTHAQKMLGELFVKQGELDKAERLYTHALEVRPLDWARLGLARVKQLRGDIEVAGDWLEKIVEDNPLFLPAYDVLEKNWKLQGENQHVQETVQRAVDVSPMSILRQKRLAGVANENDDLETALQALRRTVKLGQLSCHGSVKDHLDFAKVASKTFERKVGGDPELVEEVISVLDIGKDRFDMSPEELVQCSLLSSRVHALDGNIDAAEAYLTDAKVLQGGEVGDINVEIERLHTLNAIGDKERLRALLEDLKHHFHEDQDALQKLDAFFDEPVSEANREVVAVINRDGIDLYNSGRYDEALACFDNARERFPKHVGIQLNICQALIGKMRSEGVNDLLMNECQSALHLVSTLIDKDSTAYDRYNRLRSMAMGLIED